ncbi:pyrroloquinoline quinone precursor peptide PqqA [Pelagibacterium sp. H642]|nr:pyrroloquinoline quinone precursor peptide PqqA [Pelagibacterium sp. H642]
MASTAISPCSMRRKAMAWNKPKLTEIPVSMEINMYACAKRK